MSEIGIIKRLIAEKKLYGECPNPECGMSFPLTKAQLFHGNRAVPRIAIVGAYRQGKTQFLFHVFLASVK